MTTASELAAAQEQLTNVRSAINQILTGPGQSHSVLGRTFQKADLAELRRMEKDLVARIGRLARGGVRVQRIIPL